MQTLLSMSLIGISAGQSSNSEVIEEIRLAYERIDFDLAESRIEDALRQFDRFTPEELAEIHVFAALIRYVQNDLTGAEDQLRLALQLAPTFDLDPILAPPGLINLAEQLKSERIDFDAGSPGSRDVRYLVVEDPRPSAAMRSMLLPGWGQLYKGERRKGHILAGLWGATAGGAVVSHFLREGAEAHYLNADTQEEVLSRYDNFDRWHRVRNNLFIAAAAVWAYSYLDALLTQADPVPGNRIQVNVIPSPSNTHLQLSISF